MYDIIYIGGGLNYAGAVVAAKNGKKVALIEKDMSQLGGVCLHKGCIPSKMFLHYANIVSESDNPILEGKISLNMQELVSKKEKLLKNVTQVILKQCANVDLIEADAKLIAPYRVEADGKVLEAKNIVIATGSSAFIPDGIEYNKKDIITSDEVLKLQELPKKVAIYGAGAIALEMASFFASAKVEVTLIYRKEQILAKAHPLIAQHIQKELEKLGVSFLLEHSIKSAKDTKKGVHIVFEDGKNIYTPMLLVATGRKANIDVIECKDIEVDRSIKTDAFFETSLKDHYAVGDCNGKLQLAHAARAEVLNVTQRILGKTPKKLNLNSVVKFINTLPMSYAYVGEIKSMLKDDEYKETVVPLSQFTYSAYNRAIDGLVVIYSDKQGFILGGEILAPNAQELIGIVAIAVAGEMDAKEAQKAILAHPTFSEAIDRAFYRL